MGALSDPKFGEYVSKHFVAAYQQAGDFEVVNIGGKLKKNGGNVATCFLTPDSRVVHAVGGPASGSRMLREAEWAVKTNAELQKIPAADWKQRAEFMQTAHLAALHTTPLGFRKKVRDQLPRIQSDYAKDLKEYRENRRRGAPPLPPIVQATRKAARSLGGERAHQILVTEPFGSMAQLNERIFETLTGEKFAEGRDRVYLAAEGLKRAKEHKLPVLLVLYKGGGHNRDEYNEQTQYLLSTVFRQQVISQALTSYVVIAMPLREVPALTQLADLPTFNLVVQGDTNLVVLDVEGKQTASLAANATLEQLAYALWPELHKSMLARAEMMVKEDKFTDAMKLLRRILATPVEQSLSDRVELRIQQLTLQIAEARVEAGRPLEAMRLFRRVQSDAADDDLRQRAGDRLAALRSNL